MVKHYKKDRPKYLDGGTKARAAESPKHCWIRYVPACGGDDYVYELVGLPFNKKEYVQGLEEGLYYEHYHDYKLKVIKSPPHYIVADKIAGYRKQINQLEEHIKLYSEALMTIPKEKVPFYVICPKSSPLGGFVKDEAFYKEHQRKGLIYCEKPIKIMAFDWDEANDIAKRNRSQSHYKNIVEGK